MIKNINTSNVHFVDMHTHTIMMQNAKDPTNTNTSDSSISSNTQPSNCGFWEIVLFVPKLIYSAIAYVFERICSCFGLSSSANASLTREKELQGMLSKINTMIEKRTNFKPSKDDREKFIIEWSNSFNKLPESLQKMIIEEEVGQYISEKVASLKDEWIRLQKKEGVDPNAIETAKTKYDTKRKELIDEFYNTHEAASKEYVSKLYLKVGKVQYDGLGGLDPEVEVRADILKHLENVKTRLKTELDQIQKK